MPRATPTSFQCRQCEHRPFSTMSALRKHAWADHPEQYKKTLKTLRANNHKPKPTVKLSTNGGGGPIDLDKMTLREFRDWLVTMADTINLFGGE